MKEFVSCGELTNVMCYERVCCERVSYEMVCYERTLVGCVDMVCYETTIND